jgi:hypothetical protein
MRARRPPLFLLFIAVSMLVPALYETFRELADMVMEFSRTAKAKP